eukprot:5347617-Amphidinium_carterae.1
MEDFVGKDRPTEPGGIWVQDTMESSTCIGEDVSLSIAMQVIGSYPAAIYVSLGKVRLYPAHSLPRQQSVLDTELQVTVSALGLTSACLQRLHRFDSALT